MKNIIIIASILLAGFATKAEIKQVTIQASGLTCSMCSNAINKSLKSLDFVNTVTPNIKTSTFEITFKPGSKVDLDKLKKKVEDAGFSVATFSATIHFENAALVNDTPITLNGTVFHFLNIKNQTVNGDKTVRLLDKGFVSAKEYKINKKYTAMECYKTGVTAACCAKVGLATGTRIFHVTI